MKDQFQSGGGNPNRPNEMNCADFDQLLAEAIDGTLGAAQLASFRSHAAVCGDCGPLFTLAERGMKFVTALPEVEPPKNLVHNILAATTMVQESRVEVAGEDVRKPSWLRRVADFISPNLAPAIANLMQPRLAMTAAAAFFSISMLMNVAGVRMSDFSPENLTPSAVANTASIRYHETTAKVVKYYENLRFVYEMETRISQLKKLVSEEPATDQQQQQKKTQPKAEPREGDNTSEGESQDEDKDDKRNHAASDQQTVLALNKEFSYKQSGQVSFEG